MTIEITPVSYTNTVNGITKSLPVNPEEFLFMNYEKEKDVFSVGMPGGKNFSVARKSGTEGNLYTVTEYCRDQIIRETEVDPEMVDARFATYPEMLALSVYTDQAGHTRDFSFRVGSALDHLAGYENQAAYTDIRQDYYSALQTLMQANMRPDTYQYYLSLKSFFDYYDHKSVGVPTLLL